MHTEPSPPTLIVNADDFGLSLMINQGIEKAHQNGILTSASLMAVGAEFDSAVLIAKQNPNLGIGVHLTLVEENPLSSRDEIKSLIAKNGHFHRSAKILGAKYLTGGIKLSEVTIELERQMQKIINTGLNISHIDSHQHAHLLPGINKVICKLAAKYGIDKIRKTNERLSLNYLASGIPISRIIELCIVKVINSLNWRSPLKSTDTFAGFIHGGDLTEENLLATLKSLNSGKSVELMCHPGLGVGDENKSHWRYNWNAELEALVSINVKQAISNHNIILKNWNDI